MAALPKNFPFRDVLDRFIREHRRATSYWYVPKTRVLSDTNVDAIREMARTIGEEFERYPWNVETQALILQHARAIGVLAPYLPEADLQTQTALIRIWRKFLELLGLVWIRDDQEPVLTEAGRQFITLNEPKALLERQIAKYQLPNPNIHTSYSAQFKGLVPHIFLLQAMRRLDYRVAVEEYNLFINLAQSHKDEARIVQYVLTWRTLTEEERSRVRGVLQANAASRRRVRQVGQSSGYQRAFLTYPNYITITHHEASVPSLVVTDGDAVDRLCNSADASLKVLSFESREDWFAYYGDPAQHPSWYTYLMKAVQAAPTRKKAAAIVRANRKRVTDEQVEELKGLQIEKGIEDFYVTRLGLIEPGLKLVPKGRQYRTPVGPIDLLCRSRDGEFVVIEIKAAEATDAVFGQILRYIGWVHRSNNQANVRGIILASEFPEAARYSRIGLLKPRAEQFLQFKNHGFTTQDT